MPHDSEMLQGIMPEGLYMTTIAESQRAKPGAKAARRYCKIMEAIYIYLADTAKKIWLDNVQAMLGSGMVRNVNQRASVVHV